MTEEILIHAIKTDRQLNQVQDASIEELASDIAVSDLKVPILVDVDLNLIDGLRRMMAFVSLGYASIPAVVATTYEEATSNLARAHRSAPLTDARRIWEINQGLQAMLEERTHRLRTERQTGLPREGRKGRRLPPLPKSRELLNDALQNINVQKVCLIYRAAANGSELAQKLIVGLEDGSLTPNMAVHRLGRDNPSLSGDVLIKSEQRALLDGAVRTLSGIAKGLRKMGTPVKIPKKEFGELLNQLKQHRSELVIMIRKLEKEFKSD